MTLWFLGKSSILTKKCSCLTLASSLLPVYFDLDGIDLLLLLMFFPIEIKNEVTGKVFKVNGHQLNLFHEGPQVEEECVADLSLVLPILCHDVPWMTLEEFPSPFFYMLSLCLYFIAHSYWGQCAVQVWGEDLEKICFLFYVFSIFCLLFSCICCCFLFLYSILVFVTVYVFYFCLSVCCSVCFQYLLLFYVSVFCFYFCDCFYFLFLFSYLFYLFFVFVCCLFLFLLLFSVFCFVLTFYYFYI